MNADRVDLNRRRFFECLSAMGLGCTLMPDALVIAAQDSETGTVEMIEVAQKIAGVSFTLEEQQAIVFNPVPPGKVLPAGPPFMKRREPLVTRPLTDEALAFLPVTHLSKLIETRQVRPLSAQWFGGLTRNPWNTQQDAAGSSAGPGSATAAGLVAFSIGSDTGGSIIQPAARNGITGMRPTFGRVSRHGAMTLAWTQDTVGPMCRSAEDCALVFNAIYGPDARMGRTTPSLTCRSAGTPART